MIAEYLPIKDILSLAKSTKAYLAILSDQTYWASVFNYEAECGFFYEGTHMRNIPELNWISIYQRTTYTKDIPAVKKRNSIWSLAKGIKELLELHPPYENDDFCGGRYIWKDGIEDVPKVGGLDASARRLEIAADIKALEVPNERLIESCRILHEQYFCKTIPCQKISFQSLFQSWRMDTPNISLECVSYRRTVGPSNWAIQIGVGRFTIKSQQFKALLRQWDHDDYTLFESSALTGVSQTGSDLLRIHR